MDFNTAFETVVSTANGDLKDFILDEYENDEIKETIRKEIHAKAIKDIVAEELNHHLEDIEDLSNLEWYPDPPDPPENESLNLVRRYLDLNSFLSLLESGLWFNRIDNFSDSFEGKVPDRILQQRWRTHEYLTMEDDPPPFNLYEFREARDEITRKSTFASCWRYGGSESAVFWDAYIGEGPGLAIETTFENLKSVVESSGFDVTIGKVEYIDYREEKSPSNSIAQVFHKRIGFDDEKELRIITRRAPDYVDYLADATGSVDVQIENQPGIHIDIDPEILIDRVIPSPKTESWVIDMLRDVLNSYDIVIGRSRIDSDPDSTVPFNRQETSEGRAVEEVIEDGMHFYRIEEETKPDIELSEKEQFILISVIENPGLLREIHDAATRVPYSPFNTCPSYGEGSNNERDKIQSLLKRMRNKHLCLVENRKWKATDLGKSVASHPYLP